jgi:CRP-like cAMP-binding protein
MHEPARMSTVGLARMPLLAGLAHERLEDLAARCALHRFGNGQLLVARDAPADEVHLIVDGRVRIHICTADGREVLLTHLQEGGIVGDFAAVDGGVRTTDAHACGNVLSASLSAADFRQLLHAEPLVEERYLRSLVGLVRILTERIVELSTQAVQARIRAEVLRQAHAGQGGGAVARIEPAPRHADLAAQVGTTREQVTRELSALARDGLLQKDHGVLVVTDLPRLEALVRSGR